MCLNEQKTKCPERTLCSEHLAEWVCSNPTWSLTYSLFSWFSQLLIPQPFASIVPHAPQSGSPWHLADTFFLLSLALALSHQHFHWVSRTCGLLDVWAQNQPTHLSTSLSWKIVFPTAFSLPAERFLRHPNSEPQLYRFLSTPLEPLIASSILSSLKCLWYPSLLWSHLHPFLAQG